MEDEFPGQFKDDLQYYHVLGRSQSVLDAHAWLILSFTPLRDVFLRPQSAPAEILERQASHDQIGQNREMRLG